MSQLVGQQLSMLPGVKPYPLMNPPPPMPCESSGSEQPLGPAANHASYGDAASSPEQVDQPFQKGDRVQIQNCPNAYYNGTIAQVIRVNQKTLTLVPEGKAEWSNVRIDKACCQKLYTPQILSSPEHSFQIGDWVKVVAVQPHQSKRWLGQCGRVVKLTQARVRVELPKLNGEGRIEVPLPPEHLERVAHPNRRHSQKGHASGWIEERQGNRKRKTPTTSYFYCWVEDGQRRKRYIPSGKLYRVNQMLDQRRPSQEIVEFLQVKEQP
jgi:ribosomal protein L21E